MEIKTTSEATLLLYDSCLSCFDLVTVAIISALLILSTMLWSIGNSTSAFDHTRLSLAIHLGGFSMVVLLMSNVGFCSLVFPFAIKAL